MQARVTLSGPQLRDAGLLGIPDSGLETGSQAAVSDANCRDILPTLSRREPAGRIYSIGPLLEREPIDMS